jgi:hypothetical protein
VQNRRALSSPQWMLRLNLALRPSIDQWRNMRGRHSCWKKDSWCPDPQRRSVQFAHVELDCGDYLMATRTSIRWSWTASHLWGYSWRDLSRTQSPAPFPGCRPVVFTILVYWDSTKSLLWDIWVDLFLLPPSDCRAAPHKTERYAVVCLNLRSQLWRLNCRHPARPPTSPASTYFNYYGGNYPIIFVFFQLRD